MKKNHFPTRLLIAVLLFSVLFVLSSCGNKEHEYTADPAALAASLATSDCFTERLSEVPAQLISYYYAIDGTVTGVMYRGTGATAEEITVLTAKDANAALSVLEAANNHVTAQRAIYEKYNAAEAARLSKAIVQRYGSYIVVCVCNDNNAALDIINASFK